MVAWRLIHSEPVGKGVFFLDITFFKMYDSEVSFRLMKGKFYFKESAG